MRLPFISSRKASEAVCLIVEVSRRAMAEKDQLLAEERADRKKAEFALAQQQKKQRAVASWRYTDDRRLGRVVRALAVERAQSAAYRREIRQLTDRLFDACGYQGEPLLPAARVTLGIEDAKEES
ncbi:hypothetical protein [Nocardioides sp. NPDC006273]|uniref:hypothetical protein n=1 Tax=Actinomycetes TaxID=1760 RepID=UPI0033B37854